MANFNSQNFSFLRPSSTRWDPRNRKIWGIFVLVIFLFFLLSSHQEIKNVSINGADLVVRVASSEKDRERGLSRTSELASNEGMLFVFPKVDKYSFWMKDMNFAIDIIWIDENFQVVFIKENALPSSYPEAFYPKIGTKYVLEVSAGFSLKHKIKLGDKIDLY